MQKTSATKGAVYLSISQASLIFLGYLIHLLVGKFLGPANYGIYGLVLGIFSIINLFITLGIPPAMAKYIAEDESKKEAIKKQAFKLQMIFSLLLTVGYFFLSPAIAKLLKDPALTPYIRFSVLVIPFQALYALEVNYLNGLHLFKKQSFVTIFYSFVKLAVALGLIFFIGVYGAIAGFVIAPFLSFILALFLIPKKTIDEKTSAFPAKTIIKFASQYVLLAVALQILYSLDLFLVKYFLQDNVQTGYYNAATTLARIPYFILQALAMVLLPKISKAASQKEEAKKLIQQALRYLGMIIAPGILFASMTSKKIVWLFFSESYTPAAPALTILIIALGILAFFYILANIAAGAGRPRLPMITAWSAIILSFVLGIILVPRYHLIGAAYETLFASVFAALIIVAYIYYRFQAFVPILSLIRIVLASVISGIPTYFISVSKYLLPLEFLVLFAFYFILLVIFREIKKADWQRFLSLIPFNSPPQKSFWQARN